MSNILWYIFLSGVAGLPLFAFWNAWFMAFRCHNRGDVTRFVKWQNDVSAKWVNRAVWALLAIMIAALNVK